MSPLAQPQRCLGTALRLLRPFVAPTLESLSNDFQCTWHDCSAAGCGTALPCSAADEARSWAAGAPTPATAKDLPLQELANNHATHPAPGGVACTGANAHQCCFDASTAAPRFARQFGAGR